MPLIQPLFIFDLDGTLADTQALNLKSYMEACQSLGLKASEKRIAKGIEDGENWQLFLPEATGETAPALKKLGIAEAKQQAYLANISLAKPILSTVTILQSLHAAGYKIALATNAARANAEALLNHLKIQPLFHLYLFQEDLDTATPGKKVLFQKAMSHFKTPASLTTIFEDSPTGLKAAAQIKGATVLQVRA